MKKVGICTVYTGFNYGSALQAFATKTIVNQLGYQGEILKLSGSIVTGRDVRIKKILTLSWNMLLNLPKSTGIVCTYVGSDKVLMEKTLKAFAAFYEQAIDPVFVSEMHLKKEAQKDEYVAFVCGSDQVWNADTYYVDPFYYLSFAPKHKRIAFAPSFGREAVPKRNQKRIFNKINEIPMLSVREESGSQMIWEYLHRQATTLNDPTLVLNHKEWQDLLGLKKPNIVKQYVLAYFLDEPSKKAKAALKKMMKSGYCVYAMPYVRHGDWFNECISVGPKGFLEYLMGATLICTDSFHGTAFSVNFEKDFYVFQREYGKAGNQSSRVTSLLERVQMMDRFEPEKISFSEHLDFSCSRAFLAQEREKSYRFLSDALRAAEKK